MTPSAVPPPSDRALVEIQELTVKIAVLEERIRGREEALQLQASEYERRLDDLNHEHDKNKERNAEFVRREQYDATLNSLTVWRRTVDDWIAEARGSRTAFVATASATLSVLAILSVLIDKIWKP